MSIITGNGVETYVGKVIATREQNLAHDSYFYAYVWDAGQIVKVETGSTAYSGGDSATVDLDDATRTVVEHYMLSEVEDYINDSAPTVHVDITNGTRVKSLTSKGKAFGVVGTVVGSGSGQYGPFYKVKDEKSGRVVIVSADKVAPLDTIEITSHMWRVATAITLGDSRHHRKTGESRWLVSGFARYATAHTIGDIVETLESILSDIGDGKLFASWDDYMEDVRSTDDMGWILALSDKVAI